jgi:hypothetical protein
LYAAFFIHCRCRYTPRLLVLRNEAGFDLHAGVVVWAGVRERLEQLCRYTLRPPLALTRLRVDVEGQVSMALRHQWSDVTTPPASRTAQRHDPPSHVGNRVLSARGLDRRRYFCRSFCGPLRTTVTGVAWGANVGPLWIAR